MLYFVAERFMQEKRSILKYWFAVRDKYFLSVLSKIDWQIVKQWTSVDVRSNSAYKVIAT